MAHFEFICTGYKNWCDDIFIKLTADHKEAISKSLRNVKYVRGEVTDIYHEKNCIEINGDDKVQLNYDALVIATGATYNFPWRDQSGKNVEQRD